jgi:hypothetical protein
MKPKQPSLFKDDDGPSKYLHSQVLVFFQETWKREKGGGSRVPVIQWRRDSKLISGLLKLYPGEYVERLIRIYLTRAVFREDKYCNEKGWDIPSFIARINRCINIEATDAKVTPRPAQIPTRSTGRKFNSAADLRRHLETLKQEG